MMQVGDIRCRNTADFDQHRRGSIQKPSTKARKVVARAKTSDNRLLTSVARSLDSKAHLLFCFSNVGFPLPRGVWGNPLLQPLLHGLGQISGLVHPVPPWANWQE